MLFASAMAEKIRIRIHSLRNIYHVPGSKVGSRDANTSKNRAVPENTYLVEDPYKVNMPNAVNASFVHELEFTFLFC